MSSIDRGLLALLEAQPGKGDALAQLLVRCRELAADEEGTVTWYAFRLTENTFGIFDTFAAEPARQAHVNGLIPQELGKVAGELLAAPPDIRMTDVLAVK